ncbi:DUF5343 domain-containing protein [Paludisphaera borealis]|uniref:Uncharacterized protein n=1 Tax=Paludisphaera borealis TaxID=1387353 RepID=A0A1U7CL37_9BACT|nr:DUF5343 domain-containing protein [Paludisphaera borealis]APW59618.1 hypothetical protein BSF38_01045 [Paludisphaera borealis]
MADVLVPRSFPVLPVKHWWILRDRFRRSIPGTVSANYLSTVLAMTEQSAQANIIPSLRTTGLIDESGKPTDLARKWRDDAQYTQVCKIILDRVYPEELRDIGSDENVDRVQIGRWFANHTGGGEALIRKYSAFYITLCEADLSKGKASDNNKEQSTKTTKNGALKKNTTGKAGVKDHQPDTETAREAHVNTLTEQKPRHSRQPDIHLNIQVHISSDATPDQIDQIFSSMAKHLYNRGDVSERG